MLGIVTRKDGIRKLYYQMASRPKFSRFYLKYFELFGVLQRQYVYVCICVYVCTLRYAFTFYVFSLIDTFRLGRIRTIGISNESIGISRI